MLAKALARSIDCPVSRIQFTPDMLPSDITGVSAFIRQTGEFEFKPGPVFASIVVADEVNRAPCKTQAALLECMEERQVTVDGNTYELERPVMVIATQNPVDMEGTYPLPEAQRDRFTARDLHDGEAGPRKMVTTASGLPPPGRPGQGLPDAPDAPRLTSRIRRRSLGGDSPMDETKLRG
jgi:MoxR-like ATPase